MKRVVVFKTGNAVANSGAMETRDHYKNGDSPKIHKSRSNFLRKTAIYLFAAIALFLATAITSCDLFKEDPVISTDPEGVTVSETSEGTLLTRATLDAMLGWLDRNLESHNTYILEVGADESLAPKTLNYPGAISVTIILRGDNRNRTLKLTNHGTMFTVNTNVTFVLDNNITIEGHSQNTGSMVNVNGGILIMNNGASIIGNIRTNRDNAGSGVSVESGTFEMKGGTISNNSADSGGGVYNRGTFTMSGGTISNNTATRGAGVYHRGSGSFTLTGGTISNNTASYGGGAYIYYSTFTMSGGTISGNIASYGGGVYTDSSASTSGGLIMSGGTIIGNTATEYGGGVCVRRIIKTGGIITGYNSDQNNGNVVRDGSGVIVRRGHAVFVNENRRKETTAGPDVNLSSNSAENWDD